MIKQNGFTLIEILLVIITLSLLVFTGTYVYQSNKKADKNQQHTASSVDKEQERQSSEETEEQLDATRDWLQYSPPSGAYTIRLADGWNLTRNASTSSLGTFNNENIEPQPGVKAVVEQLEGGRDGQSGFFLNYYEAGEKPFIDDGAVKQDSFKTSSGLTVEKYLEIEQREELEGLGQVSKGGKYYTYVVTAEDGKAVKVDYSIQPDHTDHSATVEQVLKTLQIN